MASFYNVSEDVKANLEAQLQNIDLQDKETQRLVDKENAAAEGKEESKGDQQEPSEPPPQVDTYQIETLSTIVDDFENIINKNYCVYTNYEDFSFA